MGALLAAVPWAAQADPEAQIDAQTDARPSADVPARVEAKPAVELSPVEARPLTQLDTGVRPDGALAMPPADRASSSSGGASDDSKEKKEKRKGAKMGGGVPSLSAPGGGGAGGPSGAAGGGAAVSGISGVTAGSAPPPAEKPLYFRGFDLALGLSDSSGLNAVGDNYENDWILYVLPVWKAGRLLAHDTAALRDFTVSARWILSGEFSGVDPTYRTGQIPPGFNGCESDAPSAVGGLVDTSSVPYCQSGAQRRLDYSDIVFKASDKVYQIPILDIAITPGVAASLPTSAQAQYTHLITGLQASVGLSHTFFNKLIVGYGFAATKFIRTTSVPIIDFTNDPIQDPNNPQNNTPGMTSASTDLSRFADSAGLLASSYSLIHQFVAVFNLNDKISFTAMYVIGDTFKDTIPNCYSYLGAGIGLVNTCANGATVAATQGATVSTGGDIGSQIFHVGVDYQLTPALAASVGLLTASPQRHPDSSWQEPFFTANYNAYSSAFIGLTLSTEALAASIVYPQ